MEHLGKDARSIGPIDLVADVTPELLICAAAVRAGLVDACGASIMVGPDERWPLAATSLSFTQFTTVQFSVWDGPEPDVVRTGLPVIVQGLEAVEKRWPLVAPQLLTQEVNSFVSLPLIHQEDHFGVFSAYRIGPQRFSGNDIADLSSMAASIAAVAATRLHGPVGRLPESGISQSVGMLMARFTLDAGEAMAVLRSEAWKRDMTIPHLADQLTAGELDIDESWKPTV